MPAAGLGLLVLVALGIVFTGLPAFVILIGVGSIGAALAVLTDTVPLSLLAALPSRLINLLENDLLQALPLYVTMGLLLDRLPIADALYRAGLSLLPRRPSAPLVSGMALGALLGPMNGSVGASVLALARVVAPRLAESGVPKPTQFAAVAVASTLGVVIPPSLVLILLGDAMLSAHTIAVTSTGRADRVINTQDVFHGALAPAAIFLALCFALSWRAGRRIPPSAAPPPVKLTRKQAILAAITLVALLTLLGGVATGYFYAVEAAAMGAFVLLSAGFVTGALRGAVLRGVLHDGRDAEVERRQQDEQQRERHHGNGEGTPAAEPHLRAQQDRPCRDGDHGRPGRRDQERTHDPEAADDERTKCQQLQSRPGKV